MIQEKNYYIIKVETKSGCYYKIGEGYKISRPNKLIEKYNKLRANKAELLAFETLPHNSKKRLNDKTIHTKIDSAKMKKADPIYVEHYLGETDGKDEFFELVDKSLDVVDYIKSIVNSCKSKDYTANVKEIVDLDFKDRYHLVDNELIEKIEKKFSEVDDILFNHKEDNILLIGQFEPDFVASFAMHNKVMIWHDTKEQRHLFNYSRLNNNITYFEGTLEEFIEETKDMKFNLIIANPPYGKIGANITKKIIDEVEFDHYINLLPANDYKRVDDLWNYQSNIAPIKDGFADAGVTTHVAKIHKSRINSLSKEHFDISTYDNDNLTKFFSQNINRTHYAIDAVPFTGLTIKNAGYWNVDTTFILHNRDQNHASMGYKKSFTWKWNVEKSVNFDDLVSRKETNADNVQLTFCNIIFNTAVERNNFTDFMYHNHNFIRMIWTAMKVDMGIRSVGFPKVDWTRSWTVEEILADYGYTEDEIKKVMEDLKNFKGMED